MDLIEKHFIVVEFWELKLSQDQMDNVVLTMVRNAKIAKLLKIQWKINSCIITLGVFK